ncbi:hypothetical protein KP509_09G008800 [Ceratopteris richardii]|uniref:Uncharacterized protein n=1 Tax=Ceratopteris richardii TaxID=49495 RepID=A0A8T2TYT1_CERRI|nr:hypothetical protein KP509_09G008800 [Ceratopteris richardii]
MPARISSLIPIMGQCSISSSCNHLEKGFLAQEAIRSTSYQFHGSKCPSSHKNPLQWLPHWNIDMYRNSTLIFSLMLLDVCFLHKLVHGCTPGYTTCGIYLPEVHIVLLRPFRNTIQLEFPVYQGIQHLCLLHSRLASHSSGSDRSPYLKSHC